MTFYLTKELVNDGYHIHVKKPRCVPYESKCYPDVKLNHWVSDICKHYIPGEVFKKISKINIKDRSTLLIVDIEIKARHPHST